MTYSPVARDRERVLVGWLDTWTGVYKPLPEGHKKPEYTVDDRWEPLYEGDRIRGPWGVERACR